MSENPASTPSAAPTKPESRSNFRFIIPVLVLILVIAGVGYFAATHTGVDKAAVEAALRHWSEQLKANSGKPGGTPIDFTFDSVEMAGSGTDRHAIVINPSFSSKMTDDKTTTSIKTAKAKLFLTSVSLD